MVWIRTDAALYRTDDLALGFIKMSNTFRAERRVNDVIVGTHRDRLIGADGFADITVDAFSRDNQRHARLEANLFALLF